MYVILGWDLLITHRQAVATPIVKIQLWLQIVYRARVQIVPVARMDSG